MMRILPIVLLALCTPALLSVAACGNDSASDKGPSLSEYMERNQLQLNTLNALLEQGQPAQAQEPIETLLEIAQHAKPLRPTLGTNKDATFLRYFDEYVDTLHAMQKLFPQNLPGPKLSLALRSLNLEGRCMTCHKEFRLVPK